MREFKFRVWDKESKTINRVRRLEFLGNRVKINNDTDFVLNMNDKENQNIILMQYTGIKDKNGKEICAGDIVVLSEIIYNNCSKSEIEGANSFIGEIVNYKGLCMCVKYKDKNGDTLYRPLYLLEQDIASDDCSLAIIGNIYENEDLLEK